MKFLTRAASATGSVLLALSASASAGVVYPNTTWGSIPGENAAGASATITTTAPYDGGGSVELIGDRTRFTNGNYYDRSGNGLYALSSINALTFAWQVAVGSVNPYNADYTPALRLHVYDPATGARSELIWEGAYNNVYGHETKGQWYTTTVNDLFYQNVSGSGVTLVGGAQLNQSVAAWKSMYSSSAVVTALSVGDGSGASALYHAFADDVTLYQTGNQVTVFNFEVAPSATVPEPDTIALVGLSLVGLAAVRRRKR